MGALREFVKRLTPLWLREQVPMQLRRVRPRSWRVIDSLSRARKTVSFVQIGANDGVRFDPIRAFILRDRWTGLLIEPLPDHFAALQKNYEGCPALAFDRVAVADVDGSLELFRVRAAAGVLPDWVEGIASFSPDVLLTHQALIPNIGDYVVSETVPALTLKSLLAKHHLTSVTVFCVDTEGYDDAIVRQILNLAWQPELILFEHGLLGEGRHEPLQGLLEDKGFTVFAEEGDSIAYRGRFEQLKLTDVLPFRFLKR